MRDFVASDGRCVREQTQAQADAAFASTPPAQMWRVTEHAGGEPVKVNGLATFAAPTGENYQAKNLSEAIAQHWNAGRNPGTRQSAAAPSRLTLALDEAGAESIYAARQNIFKTAGTTAEDVMRKTGEADRLMAGTATRE